MPTSVGVVFAYVVLRGRSAAFGEIDFIRPCTLEPAHDVLVRDVFDSGVPVLLHIASIDDAFKLILCPSQPAFFHIGQNNLQSGLLAGDKAGVGNANVEGA